MVAVFRAVWRVLRDDGTLWLNLGDSYTANGNSMGNDRRSGFTKGASRIRSKLALGLKPKDLCMIPARVALALQADGWYLRSDIVWHKPNPMPESVQDRPTRAHEYLFLLAKQERYFYDAEAIREPQIDPLRKGKADWGKVGDANGMRNYAYRDNAREYNPAGRNKRSVWTIATQPYADAHFATFPEDLIKPCILAGSRPGDVILDPFAGSGTTGKVALELGRSTLLIELSPDYCELARDWTNVTPGFVWTTAA
jgi:DNA modification methylase